MKVVIVGGTHGNEKTGVFLLNRWRNHPERLPKGHDYFLLEGNIEAIKKNTRYVDFDFNRSFNGGNKNQSSYEYKRVSEFQKTIRDWTGNDPFFLIDLHTTTSNMLGTVVLSKTDKLSAIVAKEAVVRDPRYKLLINSDVDSESIFVETIAPHSLLVEVGPVAHNIHDPYAIELMESLTVDILKILAQWQNKELPTEVIIEGIQESGTVDYPRDANGEPLAVIHKSFQGKDFEPLNPGDPIFESLNGSVVTYEGTETIYPIFINESSYYEKRIAFRKGKKVSLKS